MERLARELALHWALDAAQAEAAGLLHDCAKGMSLSHMHCAALAGGLCIDKATWDSQALLHAPVGAYVAERDYALHDAAALDAIRWHTTGRARMARLEQVIYLADMVEPGRKPFPQMQAICDAMWTDLDQAMCIALDCAAAYVKKREQALYPVTEEALRWYTALTEKGGAPE